MRRLPHACFAMTAVFTLIASGCGDAAAPSADAGAAVEAEPAAQETTMGEQTPPPAAEANGHILHGLTMRGLDGRPVDLAAHAGDVVLLVNVASRCGFTPQYAGLQNLHERYADEGLVVIGVPANDFGNQEPGTAEEIAEFCEANYGVTFTMLDKVAVTGEEQVELYRRLTDPANDPTGGEAIGWNFEKFLIDRTGGVAGRFNSRVEPESDEMTAAIEAALAAD